ncbi:hypothetical protein GGG16DRAFT_125834 [Schizophyllum commune]
MPSAIVDATLTTPDSPPSSGEFTIFQRVYGIPLVAAAIDKLHETLSTNVLTARAYAVAQGLAVVAYQCWQPVQRRLAPLIARVDVLANTIFDLAETRFPYLFDATPEDMTSVVYNTRATFLDDARTRLDEGIKRPALHVAEEIDERLTPLLDYYEGHIEPLGHKSARSTRANEHTKLDETQYQYQRALSLLKALIERITSISSDQWQQTSFLFQRSVIQVQELSDAMLSQLHALQRTISYLATSMQRAVTATRKQLTMTLIEAANALSATIADLQATMTSEDLTTGERIDREDECDAPCGYHAESYCEDEFDAFCEGESNRDCEEQPGSFCESDPREYLAVDVGPVSLNWTSVPSNLVDQLISRSNACERKHIAGFPPPSSTDNASRHGRHLQAWPLRISSQDCDRAEPASWTLSPKRGEGKTRSIARDPATRKFPCPCGAPKHARREADKIRALCKDFDPHPGPDAQKALEVDTDDENANPAPGGPTRRTKRRARRSPSSDRAPRSNRRVGKRRATGPRPHDDSDDDEPIIVEGPSKVDSGGLATRPFGGPTNISAYGGIEHATGSRSALRKPFESSGAQDDLERQVKSLAALNLAARREYIEVICATVVRHHPSLTRYSVP